MKTVIVNHPLVQDKLTQMRRVETSVADFRRLAREIALLMGYEVTRSLPVQPSTIQTPLVPATSPVLADRDIVLVSIMRAGNGFLDGLLQLLPEAFVGHIGLARDPVTHECAEYYVKIPKSAVGKRMIVVDPMLATGHSASWALQRIRDYKPKSIDFMCLLAAPEGVSYLETHHPDITLYTASIDEKLDENKYIVPGLGDAGDRMYGTLA